MGSSSPFAKLKKYNVFILFLAVYARRNGLYYTWIIRNDDDPVWSNIPNVYKWLIGPAAVIIGSSTTEKGHVQYGKGQCGIYRWMVRIKISGLAKKEKNVSIK